MRTIKGAARHASCANRGMDWENTLRLTHEEYDRRGFAHVVKQEVQVKRIYGPGRKLVDAFPVQKSTVDYLGYYCSLERGAVPVAIEAKHSAGKSIALDRVQPHQAEFLHKWWAQGGDSFVLVLLEGTDEPLGSAYMIPYAYWEAAVEMKKGGIYVGDCGPWTTPGKKSLNAADMLACWKVDLGPWKADWISAIEAQDERGRRYQEHYAKINQSYYAGLTREE